MFDIHFSDEIIVIRPIIYDLFITFKENVININNIN